VRIQIVQIGLCGWAQLPRRPVGIISAVCGCHDYGDGCDNDGWEPGGIPCF
jgi:hypothetical protein